jgi:soluble lytic murein transglycosylase-like protein
MNKIILVLLLSLVAHSGSLSSDVEKVIKRVANEQNIEPALLIAFASVETKKSKYAIGYNIDNKELNEHKRFYHSAGIKIVYGKYGKKNRISVYPKNITEAKIAFYKVKNRKNVDFGLMQINSSNLERGTISKLEILINPYKNVEFSAKVLRECFVRFNGKMDKTAECYNKGFVERKFDYKYFNKIYKQYKENNDFG